MNPEICIVCDGEIFEPAGTHSGYSLFHCLQCGLRFTHPIPGAAEIAAIYTEYGTNRSYAAKAERKIRRSMKRIRRYMNRGPGKRFLDVGCNVGTAVEAARRLGLDAHGIDIGDQSIEIAREMFPGGHFHAGPIESLPPEWGQFDFVYSAEVIEHLPDANAYFNALSLRIKPGGLLFLTTPDAGHWRVPSEFTKWDQVFPPHHLLYFTKDAMRRFLDRHGLEVVKFEWKLKPGLHAIARRR
ncbi:Methyltransferase type 12 [Parvibaculum lavamentivorans DS-1]|uniref:Methyltransferase type 12 n=1 Tax=Parvibaculum lavamentivorans (strain DS-1 / DSM 13023 / NCIMB 13966) TaxID=402881 RepID=A7HSR2_PARL1|nr:class I SAM-dependent methyltransferase [Parvibaculum lavamentivorans]ABS62945.1 Methyltransferase type 12 [Parvibaculum lavamentivorans DS-1]